MDQQEYSEKVRDIIKASKWPFYETTNKKEVKVRCPYCGDSLTKSHAHLYIQMKPPFKFYCQKCNTAGVLNNETLRDLGISNNELAISVIEANKTIRKVPGKVSYQKSELKVSSGHPNTEKAVNYFNGRYNTHYTNEYIVNKFKAVTDPLQFFKDNRISPPKNYKGESQYDFENSIGFVSSDNTYIIFRDLTGQQQRRYYNLNLYPDEEDTITNKIYNIRSQVDITALEMTLVITEGIFDIIGVYENLYKGKVDESKYIFAAAAGKGFNAVISKFIHMGFLNLEVIIYSDSDVKEQTYRDLKDASVYLKNTQLTIYYNNLEKDYGVPADRISLRRVVI